MNETQKIERQDVGFRWHVSIDRELHLESSTRTPDKITKHASLEGHANSYDEAKAEAREALKEVRSLVES